MYAAGRQNKASCKQLKAVWHPNTVSSKWRLQHNCRVAFAVSSCVMHSACLHISCPPAYCTSSLTLNKHPSTPESWVLTCPCLVSAHPLSSTRNATMHCLAKRALSCSTTTRVASSINHTPSSCCWQLLHAAHQPHHSHAQLHTQRQLSTMSAAGSKLTEKRCEPCEASHDALDSMGLAMIMDQDTAEKYRQQVCVHAHSRPGDGQVGRKRGGVI